MVVEVARQTHARFATLSAFSLRELGGQLRTEGLVSHLEKSRIARLGKSDPRQRSFSNELVNMALEQADAIRHRYRRDLSGVTYRIGGTHYLFGEEVIALPNGRERHLSEEERDVLCFFCTYPRATLRPEDLRAQAWEDARTRTRAFAGLVGGLNAKLEGFARLAWDATGGCRIDAQVSISGLPATLLALPGPEGDSLVRRLV
jgi:hypothetical protein